MIYEANQGHLYRWNKTGQRVLSLERSFYPRVVAMAQDWEWVSPPFNVDARDLEPLPMKYFHGQVPQ